jgi:hypothetical protein
MFTNYKSDTKIMDDFYDWVLNENENFEKIVQNSRENISLFDIHHNNDLEIYDKIKIMNGPVNRPMLIEVMKKENFIFMK